MIGLIFKLFVLLVWVMWVILVLTFWIPIALICLIGKTRVPRLPLRFPDII